MFQPAITTRFFTHPLCFDILAQLFCIRERVNSIIFKRLRTLYEKHQGWGTPREQTRS